MKRTKLTTKVVSLMIAIAMLISVLPIQGLAAWQDDTLNLGDSTIIVPGTTEENMPEMKTVIVKANDAGTGYDVVDPGNLAVGNKVIVAIQANNFDKFVGNHYGLFALSTSLVYDKRYLKSTSTTRAKFKKACEDLLNADEGSF